MNPAREYDCFAVLGENGQVPLWHWDAWAEIFPAMNEILQRSQRGRNVVRCTQENLGKYRVGNVGWGESGHQRWTHNSPVTKRVCKRWEFIGMETWAPGPSQCEQEGLPPDVFVNLSGQLGKEDQYTFLLIAIAEDFKVRSDLGNVRTLLQAAAAAVKSPLVARLRKRPWGIGTAAHFNECIQDYDAELNFKITFQLERAPKVRDFPWKWQTFSV